MDIPELGFAVEIGAIEPIRRLRRMATKAAGACYLCGAEHSYPDEIVADDAGWRMFVCSDTDFCAGRRAEGHKGRLAPEGEA